jgi:phosphohistidine swiveling domain-containing protein
MTERTGCAPSSAGYVLPLADPGASLETVGGKGASLARLAAAGLPVPDGFHITTAAYQRFVAENDLQPGILAALEGVDPAQPETLEAASATIGELFAAAQVPPDIAAAIAAAYAPHSDAPRSDAPHSDAPHSDAPRSDAPLSGRDPIVAVRSSATAEDLPEASFAGQQETFLNVQGYSQVLQAVVRCWASLWTARAIGYRARQVGAYGHAPLPQGLSLAVVVQALVPAEAAGVLFTANPVTGRRDQAMISAAWGLGQAVVGGLVTPDYLTVDKASGAVVERQTADKQVMTARVDGGVEEQPVPEALRCVPVLDDRAAAELARLGVQIETLYAMPMDIEWALADGAFAILQARPITALPGTRPPAPDAPPIEWRLPHPGGQYMRGSVVDIMPNPVSPLFATLGIPAISRVGMKEVLRPLTHSEPLLPDDYILTINEYAYVGASFTPRQWWWLLTHLVIGFVRVARGALPLWRDVIHPRYVEEVARWQGASVEAMSTADLWAAIEQLNGAAMLHVASLLMATTGASAGAEMLFTRVYNKMVRRRGDPAAPTFLMGYDSTPIRGEKSLYDLAAWVRERPELARHLLDRPSTDLSGSFSPLSPSCSSPCPPCTLRGLRDSSSPPLPVSQLPDWPEFQARFQAHLRAYGHIIYELDFARPLPLDDPAPMLETVKMYLRGGGANPHERQGAAEEKRVRSAEETLSRLRGLRRWAFRKTLRMAQAMAQVRENALADIGLGYPSLRQMLRELGRRFARAGAIAQADDIYWLQVDEVQDLMANLPQPANDAGAPFGDRGYSDVIQVLPERIAQRRARHEALKRVIPPPMLPPAKKYMGLDMGYFVPAAEESQRGGMLKGIAASAGSVTAPASVLRGPEDFGRMQPGNVLVAAATTPAWTPLFAMASAVVTDIGGPLSHGSIVAREYGIPAVMGTGVATRRIVNGQVITVDGGAGTVTLPPE